MAYLKIGLGLFLLGLGGAFIGAFVHFTKKSATSDARIATAEAAADEAKRAVETLSKEMVRRAEFDRALREQRLHINNRLDQVTHEDPVARDYLGERIPDSVRNAVLGGEDSVR